MKVIEPVNLELSVPPMEILGFESRFLTINVRTPSNFSVQLLTGRAGDRFERDPDLVSRNSAVREKVVSDGRD